MIGQNRQAAFQQAKADHDYQDVNTLLEENTALTRTIQDLTGDVRDRLTEAATTTGQRDDRERGPHDRRHTAGTLVAHAAATHRWS